PRRRATGTQGEGRRQQRASWPFLRDLCHFRQHRAAVGWVSRRETEEVMKRAAVLKGGAAVVVLGLGGLGGGILFLPAAPAAAGTPAIDSREAEAIVAAMKPPKRQRPVIAVVGINHATETTDYLMPAGILRRADVAHVMTLATDPGPVALYPALK